MTTGQGERALISPNYMQARKFGIGPDFAVYTRAMVPMEGTNQPIVQMRGSSTVMDLQEDTMMLSALHDMQQVEPGLTLWLNHSYNVPDDVYGKLWGSPRIEIQNDVADLWLAAETCLSNPAAEKTYKMIVQDGLRLGCSVGCIVLEWSFSDPDDEWNSPILIHRVKVIEWSVVGIPANQRCWVENSIKGIFARSLVEGNGDEALKLAPAYKGLYHKEWRTVLDNITSPGLKKDLARVPMRGTNAERITYDYQRDSFTLVDARGVSKSLSTPEVSTILRKYTRFPQVSGFFEKEEGSDEKDSDLAADEDLLTTKTVTGKTSWPLAPLATEWTGSKAEQAIFDYAGGDDFSPAKAKQGFLYQDASEDPKTRKAYKMPFCYAGDGGLKIVPLGVRAAANVLAGGMGGIHASDADIAGMKAKVKTMINRINRELSPDPAWEVPWEKKEDDAGDGVLSTENGGEALVRQDLGENEAGDNDGDEDDKEDEKAMKAKVKAAADVKVSADGSHEPCTGDHEHSHKAYGDQGDDEMHNHMHTHKGDAHHGHEHEEKSTTPPVTKSEEPGQPGEEEKEQPTTPQEPETPPPTAPAAQETPEAEETPEPTTEEAQEPETPAAPVEDQAAQPQEQEEDDEAVLEAKLSLYNDMGASLQLPAMTWEAFASYRQAAQPGLVEEDQALTLLLSLMGDLKLAEGRAISAASGAVVKKIHDLAVSLHPPCCPGQMEEDNGRSGGADEDGDNDGDEDDKAKAIADSMITSASLLEVAKRELAPFMERARQDLEAARQESKQIADANARARAELKALTDQIARVARMPLGRPTHLTRRVEPTREASYHEMLAAGSGGGSQVPGDPQPILTETLAELEPYTRITEKQVYAAGSASMMKYRHWPAGIGGAVGSSSTGRPPLTDQQKMFMLPGDWEAYAAGLAADVPMLDDPFEVRG